MWAALNDVRYLHSHSVVFEDVRDACTCQHAIMYVSSRYVSASGMLAVDIEVLGCCDQLSQTFQEYY